MAILLALVLGLTFSGAGAGLAVTGFADSGGQASVAQYGNDDSGGDVLGEGDDVVGEGDDTPASDVQPAAQVESAGTGGELPFTGFAAIPVLVLGLALLGAGVVLRRQSTD